ncbi:aminodeoxychorismate synthase component I [Pseudonocardia eucalypti]|uniref:Aminodeoxychorismate synthase component I n=1 Tax=Pseudonocardia eucalypti TaxID=648755 RepID=A0ABP9QE29_9PSEU|nr:para-aminobenzoate synthetase/4-amino-4-deoxychorismate lyase [Pseudonocardia eucalypti]
MTAWARFDDLRTNTALRFGRPDRVITAERPGQVAGALGEVDRATRAGGWAFGYLAYEAASGLDPQLATHPPAEDGPPLLWFGVTGPPEQVPPVRPSDGGGAGEPPHWHPTWRVDDYHARVGRVREHIAAGETYQCNLTVRLAGKLDTGDTRLDRVYADLALAQRGGYCAYLDLGRFVVASASPELFLHWRGDRITTRPMKGTSVRGREPGEDLRLAEALRASAKERAENVMIVDLMRNDLARLARTGGVRVESLFDLERYETVWQLTSRISAHLRPGLGLTEVFRALFPCGSVTGAPKPRTMRLITELEDGPRGVYCGAVGWLAPPDAPERARFSVAIRTAVLDRESGTAEYGTGGGITWSSDPAAEHAELLAKSAVLHHRPREFTLRETLGFRTGEGIRHLDAHLARLARSADYFGFTCDLAAARTALSEAAAEQAGDAMLRLGLNRDSTVEVEARPLPPSPPGPVRLALEREPIDTRQPWPYHKTSLREPYAERLRRHPDADDVILVNERGELTEATIANLALRLAGRWYTPPLSAGCLPGIERGRLVADGTLTERVLGIPDLAAAEALALVSSVRGWRTAVLGG